jgi:hypothetical protein
VSYVDHRAFPRHVIDAGEATKLFPISMGGATRSTYAARRTGLILRVSFGGEFGGEFLPTEYGIDVGKLRHRRPVSL